MVPGFPDLGGVCCPSGTTCSTTEFGGITLSQCCPDGEIAQIDPSSGELSVACAPPCGDDLCPVSGILGLDGVCCPSGTTCSTTSFASLTFAQCCPEGQSIRLSQESDGLSVECAPTCPTD